MEDPELIKILHNNLLQELKFIDYVCKKEGIKYSLLGGTLIGAIRHDGFIPWDDDVDVAMDRADFIRFKSIINKYINETDFVWQKPDRVEGITQKYGFDFKGVRYRACSDIFILDNVPDDERKFKKHIFKLKKLQGMMKKGKIDWSKYSLKGKILVWGTKMLGKFYSMDSLIAKYERLSVKYNDKPTKRKIISNDVYNVFSIPFKKEVFEEVIAHRFETEEFFVFKHYDEILTAHYGDYMTPPPIEKQISLHVELTKNK